MNAWQGLRQFNKHVNYTYLENENKCVIISINNTETFNLGLSMCFNCEMLSSFLLGARAALVWVGAITDRFKIINTSDILIGVYFLFT